MVRFKIYGLEVSLVWEFFKEWLYGVKSSLLGIILEEEVKVVLERGGWDLEGFLIVILEDCFMFIFELLVFC